MSGGSRSRNQKAEPSDHPLAPRKRIAYYPCPRKQDQMQAYCMKCHGKKEIKNPRSIVMKNKRPAT